MPMQKASQHLGGFHPFFAEHLVLDPTRHRPVLRGLTQLASACRAGGHGWHDGTRQAGGDMVVSFGEAQDVARESTKSCHEALTHHPLSYVRLCKVLDTITQLVFYP